MRYLRGTAGIRLLYDYSKELIVGVMGYVNSNFVGDRNKRHFITRYLFGFGVNLVN